MDTIETSRIMAFDLVNSLMTENYEHTVKLINSSITMGPEHVKFFIHFIAHVFDGIQESVKENDPEYHEHIRKLLTNPTDKMLEFYRTLGGAVE